MLYLLTTQLILQNMDKLAKQWHTDNDRFYLFSVIITMIQIFHVLQIGIIILHGKQYLLTVTT